MAATTEAAGAVPGADKIESTWKPFFEYGGREYPMEVANIPAEQLKMDQENWKNAASNWKMILQKMLPQAEAEEVKKSTRTQCT